MITFLASSTAPNSTANLIISNTTAYSSATNKSGKLSALINSANSCDFIRRASSIVTPKPSK